MRETTDSSRVNIISIVMIVAAALCVGRLFQLQVINHETYALRASQEHLRKYEIPAERGTIYMLDRNQEVPVAFNRQLKTLFADPRYIQDPAKTASQLVAITAGDSGDYQERMLRDSYYVVLERGLTPEKARQIEALELYGIGLVDESKRVYPEGVLGSHILGYVNADGEGQYGIEQYFDDILRGTPGMLDGKTDIRGIPIATADNIQIEAQAGSDVVLTIDRNIQAKVEAVLSEGIERYQAQAVSAIVMEADTGKIRAMANYPTFDPNNYQETADFSVFGNRAVTNLYEPGSTFKIFTMAAGLEEEVVKKTTTYLNKGYELIDGHRVENAEYFGDRHETMIDAIAHSVNTGMIYILKMLSGGEEITTSGKEKLYSYFVERFNFAARTGIEVPGEPTGEIVPPAGVSDVQYANMTFGQGLTATMTQVVAATAAVLNGGTYYRPTLIDYTVAGDGEIAINEPEVMATDVVSRRTGEDIKEMMEAVVLTGGGFSTRVEGYRIGGKTGTAQIPNPEGGYFTDRDIGSFLGAAPLDKPRYILLVRVDDPRVTTTGWAGSGAAAPMFGEILKWLLQYDGIAPSG